MQEFCKRLLREAVEQILLCHIRRFLKVIRYKGSHFCKYKKYLVDFQAKGEKIFYSFPEYFFLNNYLIAL